jgi:DNA uptake protein ComE-like DNA-binding protein
MRIRRFGLSVSLISIAVLLGTACSPNETPDQIRQKTAQDTATLKRDTKAVAEGIKEGLSSKKDPVDLNKASRDDLAGLPGLDDHKAGRIIADRPYASAHQLVTRHVLSEDQYAQIQDRIVVTR